MADQSKGSLGGPAGAPAGEPAEEKPVVIEISDDSSDSDSNDLVHAIRGACGAPASSVHGPLNPTADSTQPTVRPAASDNVAFQRKRGSRRPRMSSADSSSTAKRKSEHDGEQGRPRKKSEVAAHRGGALVTRDPRHAQQPGHALTQPHTYSQGAGDDQPQAHVQQLAQPAQPARSRHLTYNPPHAFNQQHASHPQTAYHHRHSHGPHDGHGQDRKADLKKQQRGDQPQLPAHDQNRKRNPYQGPDPEEPQSLPEPGPGAVSNTGHLDSDDPTKKEPDRGTGAVVSKSAKPHDERPLEDSPLPAAHRDGTNAAGRTDVNELDDAVLFRHFEAKVPPKPTTTIVNSLPPALERATRPPPAALPPRRSTEALSIPNWTSQDSPRQEAARRAAHVGADKGTAGDRPVGPLCRLARVFRP
ncbi:hypothetical protein VTK73DRAFT_6676 [Phialemonium thermophilum]|uniref:Uncharacterized protein n=1 Tax=Phialemonium thermophilum TaxID=223376 RepID=A0ABR3WIM6_9PEZI